MKTNAQAVANCLLDLAKKENSEIRPLRMVKLVYITHGFSLALYDKVAVDETVEAWRYGPVVPSIYHEFKEYGRGPIMKKAIVTDFDSEGLINKIITPSLIDEEIKKVAGFVWSYYKVFNDTELIDITHKKGTPWDLSYKAGQNKKIPNSLIKEYYLLLTENILKDA